MHVKGLKASALNITQKTQKLYNAGLSSTLPLVY